MRRFIFKPDITFYEGIKIDKETKLEFENEYVKQSINNLVLKTNKKEKTDKIKEIVPTGNLFHQPIEEVMSSSMLPYEYSVPSIS